MLAIRLAWSGRSGFEGGDEDPSSGAGLRPPSRMHVVARGETLSLIAARHGVGVDSIREANRRRDDTVRVGEALTIPLMASAPK